MTDSFRHPDADPAAEASEDWIDAAIAEGYRAAGREPPQRGAPASAPSGPAAAPSGPPAAEEAAEPVHPAGPLGFEPVPVAPRVDGWSAERQRIFIQTLAETGSVSEACETAGCTPRSAYRLRMRPDAASFDAAWRRAYELGIHRLTAVAFERALHGIPRQVRRNGEVVGEERVYSERLLMFLLQRYDSTRYGNLSGLLPVNVPDPTAVARKEMPKLVAKLTDHPDQPDADIHDYFQALPTNHFPDIRFRPE